MTDAENSVVAFKWDGSGLIVEGAPRDVDSRLNGGARFFRTTDGSDIFINPNSVLFVRPLRDGEKPLDLKS